MHSITVRNLSNETIQGLKLYAKGQGKSLEAFLRTLLDQAARPTGRVKLGSLIVAQGELVGEDTDLGELRDKTPYVPPKF